MAEKEIHKATLLIADRQLLLLRMQMMLRVSKHPALWRNPCLFVQVMIPRGVTQAKASKWPHLVVIVAIIGISCIANSRLLDKDSQRTQT